MATPFKSTMSSWSMRTRRRRRPQSRGLFFAATTTAAIIAIATFTSSTYTVDAASRAGLRGPQHRHQQQQQQQLTTKRQIPQHGNKRPNRPANLPPHMLPPHDGHGRFLSAGHETSTTAYQNNGVEKGRTHENASREVREVANNKGKEIKLSETEKNNLKRPKNRKKQSSSLVDENDPARTELIEEVNAWRHQENQILKQRQRKKDKPKKQQKKQKNLKKKQQKRKKDKDKAKDNDKKDKDNNKKDNDKKDKDNNNKDNDKKDKDNNKKDNDKKDKDNNKKDKKDKKDKDKKDKDKLNKNKNDGKVGKPDKGKDKPNENNGNGKKPNKNKGNNGKKPNKKKPNKIGEPKSNNISFGGGNKPKPNNISFGGGSNSQNLRPDPTPRPTRRPKAAKNDSANDVVVVSVSVNKPADPTPRPTRRPSPANDVVVVSVSANKPAKNDDTNDANAPSGNSGESSGWNFVKSLVDTSSQLDGFERTSKLDWDIGTKDPWRLSNTFSYEGSKSLQSGINLARYDLAGGEPVFSNATLTTPKKFEGGVLSFMILAGQLELPNEAFFVSVDGEVELPPALTNGNPDGWVEYSVVVPEGKHKVTWSHVYNPFGMKSLPLSTSVVGLWMDDLRYAPFTSDRLDNTANMLGLSDLKMTNSADGVDSAVWKVDSTGVVASTSDFKNENDGSADIQFVLNSRFGGTLKYKVKADTTAPHDDFAILLNGDVRDAVFGEMVSFEHRELVVPPGKQVVTLRHRKNPGRFGSGLLNSLGEVGTMGKTWLGDLSFVENVY